MRLGTLAGLGVLIAALVGAAIATCAPPEPVPGPSGTDSARAATPDDPAANGPDRPSRRAGESGPDARPDDASRNADGTSEDPALSGRVVDRHHGKPVEGAHVALFAAPSAAGDAPLWPWMRLPQGFPDTPLAATSTDDDGRFVFRDARPGGAVVVVSSEGYGTHFETVTIPDPHADVRLVSEGQPALRYVDTYGTPVVGAAIWVRGGDLAAHVPARTDEHGDVTLDVADGEQVWALADGHAPHVWTYRFDGGHRRIVHVMESGRTLEGRVIDAEGGPIAGARVTLDDDERPYSATSDTDGAFALRGLLTMSMSNNVRLRVEADGFAARELWCSADTGPVTVRLRPPVVLRVRVVDEAGRPFPVPSLRWETRSGAAAHVTTTEDGDLRLMAFSHPVAGRLSGWTYRKETSPQGHEINALWTGECDLAVERDGQEVELRLVRRTNAFVAVRVVDPEGVPVEGARVAAHSQEGRQSGESTAANGIARLAVSAEPGELVAVIAHDREIRTSSDFLRLVARADRDTPPVELRLRAETTYRLRFLDASGRPAGGIAWSLRHAHELETREGYAVEDDAVVRTLSFPEPRPVEDHIPGLGRYVVPVEALASAPLRDGVRTVDVRLQPSATVRGALRLRDDGVPAASVRLEVATDGEYHEEETPVDAEGAFRFAGFPPGPFVLTVVTPDSSVLAIHTGTLAGGQDLDLGDLLVDPSLWTTTTIVTADERSARGASVEYLYPPDWLLLDDRSADSEGRVRGPPADERGRILRATLGDQVAIGLDRRSQPLHRLRLAPEARLSIGLDGAEWSDVELGVQVQLPGTSIWIEHEEILQNGTDRKLAVVDFLPAARVRLRVMDSDERTIVERELDVRAGEVRTLTFRIERPAPSDDE